MFPSPLSRCLGSVCRSAVYQNYSCDIIAIITIVDCMRFSAKSQEVKGRGLGLTMLRQSKSPRASPRTSISAVARLLA